MDNEKLDLRIRRTHKLLYNALLSLMEKQSFEAITVQQICDLAMVHRTTFYSHFNDKYDLLTRTLRQIAEEEFMLNKHTPPEIFQELFETASKHKSIFSQLLSEDRNSLRNIIRREMGAGIKEYLNTTFQLNSNSIDTEIVTEAHIGAILGVLNWWIENKMPIDQGEIYKRLENWNFSVFNNKMTL
ncbi:TetR/AcrR family transcriptional regulator [Paenibacillus algorifonticola]|uniref:TetR/AcrR family transcriptional regulator n=1 Tax=Paenibacillus algorifonticola TaxID=684063 RepID=UPI003D2C70D6